MRRSRSASTLLSKSMQPPRWPRTSVSSSAASSRSRSAWSAAALRRERMRPCSPGASPTRRISSSAGCKPITAARSICRHTSSARRRSRRRSIPSASRSTPYALNAYGLSCEIVAGAGTGTFAFEAESGVYNELQVGSYVFMDTEYARIGNKDGGLYTAFEHSLFVLTTVISVPADDRAIVDAGLKSYSGEKGPPWVHGREDVEVTNISDEHGKLKIGPKAKRLRLGEKVWLIPGHCDPTVNLHDWYVGVRRGRVEALWPITARGAST